jgi:hypothetical protein
VQTSLFYNVNLLLALAMHCYQKLLGHHGRCSCSTISTWLPFLLVLQQSFCELRIVIMSCECLWPHCCSHYIFEHIVVFWMAMR